MRRAFNSNAITMVKASMTKKIKLVCQRRALARPKKFGNFDTGFFIDSTTPQSVPKKGLMSYVCHNCANIAANIDANVDTKTTARKEPR